jgi:pilus assembly protein TadC
MIRIARSAEASGAALAGQLGALAESELASDEAATEERLARLPIKMLFPLALLILPGFLLVAVAPAVISGIARLGL